MDLDFVKEGTILFIGAHPDDVELGCGGLLHKLKQKNRIFVITLSKNQKNPKNKNLVSEQKKCLKILGVPEKNILFADFITREFSYSRQKVCDYLTEIKKKLSPTTVFIVPNDLHQDHQVVNSEAKRVFRTQNLLEFYIPRSTVYPTFSVFVKLNKENLNAKIKALSMYKTYKNKNYFSKEAINSLSVVNGLRFDLGLSECFTPISIFLN